jgi:hypothetical protein
VTFGHRWRVTNQLATFDKHALHEEMGVGCFPEGLTRFPSRRHDLRVILD